MAKSITQSLDEFRGKTHQISDEQWELILPILKKQIRERRASSNYTLTYSPRAGRRQRCRSGQAFYRAVKDYCSVSEARGSAGVFIYPDGNSLCFEVVGWVVD